MKPKAAYPFEMLPRQHYGVILADPPWKFRVWSEKGDGRAAPYSTMTLPEIEALPVQDLAARDCLLVMWTTAPFLEVSMDVMRKWGFTFSTAGAWAKMTDSDALAVGTGYRWRSSAEFWLASKRGKPRRAKGLAIPNCIIAPRREHSRKPSRLHEDLEAMFPDEPKCELFARASRAGWDVWGNQSTLFDQDAP